MKGLFVCIFSILILGLFSCAQDTPGDSEASGEGAVVFTGEIYTETSFTVNSFDYDGKAVKVTVYSRDAGDAINPVVFKYGDLINRAINYKASNPAVDVEIRFAIYKIGEKAYIGITPSDSTSYGYVAGYDHGGARSENLIDLIVKAAYNGVKMDFVYQEDVSGNTESYLNSFMNDPCASDPSKKVSDYLRIRKITWGSESYQQMHSKFMTVSHYASDDDSLVSDTVYMTSADVEDYDNKGIPVGADWVQSGTLINGHPELKDSYDSYFNIIFNNYDSQTNFHASVRTAHSGASLNYDDTYFSSYFYPIPESPAGTYTPGDDGAAANCNGWDEDFNPYAKYIEEMAVAPATDSSRYLKTNVYHLQMDNFGKKFYDRLDDIYNDPVAKTKGFRLVVNTNGFESVYPLDNFNNIDGGADGGVEMVEPVPTNAKDTTFAFSGPKYYYSITGSANYKLDAFCSKANNIVVIKEFTSAHPVYNEYKAIFGYLD